MRRNCQTRKKQDEKGKEMKEQRMQRNTLTRGLRLLSAMIVVILTIGVTTVVGMAASGTVKSSNVNVRSEASATSTAVATVTTNDVVTILSETTGADGLVWYNITTAGGVSGYIRSDFVNKSAESVPSNTTVTPTDSKTAYVAGTSGVRIRKDASTSSDLVATATGGTELTITGEATAADGYKWYQISFSGNGTSMKGFIRSDLVTFTAPVQTPEVTEIPGTMGETSEEEPIPEQPSEAPSESIPESTTPENTTPAVPAGSASVNELTIMQPTGAPAVLPAGFQEVTLDLGDREVTAWYRGDFYILYATKNDGTEGWFLYDYQNRSYLRCEGLFDTGETQVQETEAGGINFKIVSIILAVLLVVAIAVIAFMGYKLANIEYDDDDYDDDDEEDEEPEVRTPVRERAVIRTETPVRKSTEVKRESRREESPERSDKKSAADKKKGIGRKFIDYFTEEVDEDDYDEDDDDRDTDTKEDIDYIDF